MYEAELEELICNEYSRINDDEVNTFCDLNRSFEKIE